jgi:site-specific DNA-methyltransferase (adenine-specific)
MIELIHGDCLEEYKKISTSSVDLVLTDPPYGIIADWYDWDIMIKTEDLFKMSTEILRQNGKLILFSKGQYMVDLIKGECPTLQYNYKYVWIKHHFSNALNVNSAPVSQHEDIYVWGKKYDMNNPLREYARAVHDYIGKSVKEICNEMGHRGADHFLRFSTLQFTICTANTYQEMIDRYHIDMMENFKSYDEISVGLGLTFNIWDGGKYKSDVLNYKRENTRYHNTQKPVLLLEDLIKTYTNPGDLVVDLTMGSGSTGVTCMNTGRRFKGIEKDPKIFKTAVKRIKGNCFMGDCNHVKISNEQEA